MTRPGRVRVALALAGIAAALAIALALTGAARGIALYAYVLALTALAVAALRRMIGSALPPTRAFQRLLPVRVERETHVPQLDGLVRRLADGAPNAFDLHNGLRPLVREIAAARLARRHGIELEHRPERARELVGARTWELVRPDREAPHDRHAPGWSIRELVELVDELERI